MLVKCACCLQTGTHVPCVCAHMCPHGRVLWAGACCMCALCMLLLCELCVRTPLFTCRVSLHVGLGGAGPPRVLHAAPAEWALSTLVSGPRHALRAGTEREAGKGARAVYGVASGQQEGRQGQGRLCGLGWGAVFLPWRLVAEGTCASTVRAPGGSLRPGGCPRPTALLSGFPSSAQSRAGSSEPPGRASFWHSPVGPGPGPSP